MLAEQKVRLGVQMVESVSTASGRSSPASAARGGRVTPAKTRFPQKMQFFTNR